MNMNKHTNDMFLFMLINGLTNVITRHSGILNSKDMLLPNNNRLN